MGYQWQTGGFEDLSGAQLYAALRLRQQVFAVEQQSIYLDLDNLDQAAIHIMCWQDSELLAYQRCLPPGVAYPESAIGRIVVCPSARGRQLGRELVRRGIDHNHARWPGSGIRINAQSYLREYYESLGFVAVGEDHEEDGIWHIQMLYEQSAALQ